jgi:hypothetical protein
MTATAASQCILRKLLHLTTVINWDLWVKSPTLLRLHRMSSHAEKQTITPPDTFYLHNLDECVYTYRTRA